MNSNNTSLINSLHSRTHKDPNPTSIPSISRQTTAKIAKPASDLTAAEHAGLNTQKRPQRGNRSSITNSKRNSFQTRKWTTKMKRKKNPTNLDTFPPLMKQIRMTYALIAAHLVILLRTGTSLSSYNHPIANLRPQTVHPLRHKALVRSRYTHQR